MESLQPKKWLKNFKDNGLRNIFKSSLIAIHWFIKIGKHIGNTTTRKFEQIKWRNGNTEVGIQNNENEYLYVPVDILNYYSEASPRLLEKISKNIEENRELSIGVIENGVDIEETISIYHKHIFDPPEENEEILFPELTHGKKVELEGYTTKGNQTANSIGFRFENHILTCYPTEGSIVRFRSVLFTRCRIIGIIDRIDDRGQPSERRPKINFSELILLENKLIE